VIAEQGAKEADKDDLFKRSQIFNIRSESNLRLPLSPYSSAGHFYRLSCPSSFPRSTRLDGQLSKPFQQNRSSLLRFDRSAAHPPCPLSSFFDTYPIQSRPLYPFNSRLIASDRPSTRKTVYSPLNPLSSQVPTCLMVVAVQVKWLLMNWDEG